MLTLKRSTFSDVDEIDTLEAFPERRLYILQLVRNGALGHFSLNLAFEKQVGQSLTKKLRYEVDSKSHYRISKDFVSFIDVKMGERNWGWFEVLNGNVIESLRGIDKIHDSIKKANRNFFVQENGGYIMLYRDGDHVKTLNYGNFITKYKGLNFDSLDYNLYKVDGDSVIIASKFGNDLFRQRDGTYFIPKPGYGVKRMYNKKDILRILDSTSHLSSPPFKLQIEPIE